MMRVTSLLLILGIFCSTAWARAQRQTEECGPDEYFCGADSHVPCILEVRVCNGYVECADGRDEDPQMCENYQCPGVRSVRCEGESWTRRCIFTEDLCNGFNDCGNYWDEDLPQCVNGTCGSSGYIKCPNGRRCFSEEWLCDGEDDCGDNSDEDPSLCSQHSEGNKMMKKKTYSALEMIRKAFPTLF